MVRVRCVLVMLTLCWVSLASAQVNRSVVLGRRVEVQFAAQSDGSLVGELIAVGRDSLWLLRPGQLLGVRLGQVRRVRVDRGTPGHGLAVIWTLIGAAVSGGLLTAACDCAELLGLTVTVWGVTGAIAASSLESSKWENFPAPRMDTLKRFARFPQGLPDGVDYRVLKTNR